ncbi:MAG: HAMP domain-containing histidine kinase [Actinobacteria bacterium]|nr:HAMP domain-containing histidine kinase [Actinomycetota bacterium]
MFALVVGALVFAGGVTLGLTSLDSVAKTESQLVVEAEQLALGVQKEVAAGGGHNANAVLRQVLNFLKEPLNLQGEAVYGVQSHGTNLPTLYNFLEPSQPVVLPGGLRQDQLVSQPGFIVGLPVKGHRQNLAWAAKLFSTRKAVEAKCPGCQFYNLVVVLTRKAPAGVGSAGTWFAIAAAATMVVSLLAATRLGRRIARPLQQVEAVTGRIAAGDLSARVPIPAKEGHELVSLATSVNQMADSLARARGAQRQFLMSVSHDLRTPLTSIRGYAEALADGATDDVPRAAGVVLSEARRLERLVGDLLELAKLEAGSFSLSCTKVDLFDLAHSAVEAFEPAATSFGLLLELRSSGDGAPVVCYADPDRLGQVVANVVENALKYARQRVTVTAGYAGPGAPSFAVEDDGPGIPAEDLDNVFKRLYQSSSAASRKLGSGLGLAIVKELVTAMGGTVMAESPTRAGGGTRIVVTLSAPQPSGPVGRASSRGAVPAAPQTREAVGPVTG